MRPIAKHAHRLAAALALSGLLWAAPLARAGKIPLEEPTPAPASSAADKAWKVLMYLPDRVFDLFDVVRLQVRAGPGWALGARITRSAPIFVGDYRATWLGLPGPRGRPKLPLPFGLASQTGFAFGPAAPGGGESPDYGRGEIGAVAHVYMLGFDVGFDAFELADFFAGFAGVDLAHDDY